MRSRIYILSVVAFFILTSSECDDEIYFKKPQPEIKKDRTGFDRHVQGTYLLLGRNFSIDKYFGLEPQDIQEFVGTLSGILDLGIRYTDSTWLKIEEDRIITLHRQNLFLEKQTFRDYVKKTVRLNDIESVRALLSTTMFTRLFKPDSIFMKDDEINIQLEGGTIYLRSDDNTFYVLEGKDTVGEIIFSMDQGHPPVMSADSILRIVITDSSLCIYEEKGTIQEITITDNTLQAFENGKYEEQAFLSEDSFVIMDEKDSTSYPVSGNQINFTILDETDTLFAPGEKTILRKFRGDYFLNYGYCHDSCTWKVYRLAPGHNGITLSYLNVANDLMILKGITGVTELPGQSYTDYSADPTRREFLKFLKAGGFSNIENYRMLK